MARKAEVLFIGDAASIVAAAKQAEEAAARSATGASKAGTEIANANAKAEAATTKAASSATRASAQVVGASAKTEAESKKAASTIEKSHTSIGSSFGGMAKRAVAAGVAMGGAYLGISAVKGAVNATEDLAHSTLLLTKNFGLSVKEASEWGAVTKARGIQSNQLTMSFKALSVAIHGAQGGSKTAVEAFNTLGISQQTLAAHGNDLHFMLNAVSDGLAKLPPGTDRAALQAKLFGRTWMGLSPLLREGSKNLSDQLNMADKYGATFSGKGVKGLEDMIKAQRDSKLATLGLQVAFGQFLAPVLTKIITAVAKLVSGFRSGTGAGGILRAAFDVVVTAGKAVVAVISAIVGWFDRHKAATALLVGAMVPLVAAFTALKVIGLVTTLMEGMQAALVTLRIATLAEDGALAINPFMAIATAIAIVVAALVALELKTHFIEKAFGAMRDALTAVFNWLKGAAIEAFNIVKKAAEVGLLGPVGLVITHFNALKNAAMSVFNWLKNAAVTAFNVVKTAIEYEIIKPFNAVVSLFKTIFNVGKSVLNWIGGAATSAFEIVKKALTIPIGAFHTIINAFNGLISFIASLPGRIAKVAVGMWDGIKGAFRDAIDWIIRGWNSLHFHVPGFSIGPVGWSGFDLGLPHIPLLAAGGNIQQGGSVIVGDAGPEVLHLPRGAQVTPLGRGPGMSHGGGGSTVNINGDVHFTGTRAARAFADRLAYRATIGTA